MIEIPAGPVSSEAGRWKPKTAETVARRVVQTIVSGGLTAGDKLPREAEMVEHCGVGRETLREALRLLETQGLITLRRGPGGGPVVASADAVNLGRISTLYYQMTGATTSSWSRPGPWPRVCWPSAPHAIPTPRCVRG